VWNPIHERVADSSFFEVRSSLSLPFHYIDRYSTSFYLSTFVSQYGRVGLGSIRDVHAYVADGFKNKNKVRQSIVFYYLFIISARRASILIDSRQALN
jgi:hypothetical protein